MGAPAAITGLGCVCGLGSSVASVWQGLVAGTVAIGPFAVFPHERQRTHVAAAATGVPMRLSRRHSRVDAFALHAAREALAEAAPPPSLDRRRIGVFFATSTAGMLETEEAYERLAARGGRARILPFAAQQSNAPGDAVARALGARGPVVTVSTACVSSAQALLQALDALRDGEIDLAIAGGADGLCRLTYAGFNALRAVDARPCRPFRAAREGLSLGEGAAVLVLERAPRAGRGAPLGWLAGAGSTCDAHHMSAPEPNGDGATRAIREALADAGLGPDSIDFVNAHGTGTPLNDAAEAKALRETLGGRARAVPVTSTKSLVGHLLGAAGALEALVTALCLRAGRVHPTAGEGPADAALGLDVVIARPRELPDARVALSVNLAFGGANTALVLTKGPVG